MSESNRFFIEVESSSRITKSASVGGELCMTRREGGHTIVVMVSVGESGGIEANIQASIIASMAMTYTLNNQTMGLSAKSILETFEHISKGFSFIIIDVNQLGLVRILEHNTKGLLFIRDMAEVDPERWIVPEYRTKPDLHLYEFQARTEDRVIVVSKGVLDSGRGTNRMKDGWGRKAMFETVCQTIEGQNDISAMDLAHKLIGRAEMNELFEVKRDMSCVSLYFRLPRKMLLCSGPPFSEKNDRVLGEIVQNWQGTKVISGGTTSQIISRELRREINVNLRRDVSGLPPTAQMDGVDLITEGVLTLARVKSLLERVEGSEFSGRGIDYDLVRMFLCHDVIEFVVGTRINAVHQDPNLPIELELRRNVIKEIARLLETKFLKQIKISYL